MHGGVVLTDQNTSRERLIVMTLPDNNPIVRELKGIDPHLSVVMVSEYADEPGLAPGCWHVRRENAGSIDTFLPIVGPNGEYRMPDSAVPDQLRRRDLWRDDVEKEVRRYRDQKEKDRKADELEAVMARREEMALRLKGQVNPSMNFDAGRRWRASHGDWKR